MTLRGIICLAAVLLSACGGTGPIFRVQDALYDWVTAPETIDMTSDQRPIFADPVVTFQLAPGDRRSVLQTGQDWRLGHNYLVGFDLRLDRKSLGNETVDLSRIYRTGGDTATEIVSVSLDTRRGVTIMGRTCIPASDLGEWHRVEMRIRLSNKDSGFLEVFCDRKPIWARTNMRTTFPPVCRRSEGCDAVVPKPARYQWQIGVMSDRRVARPVKVQMQRLHYRMLFYIPNRAGTL